MNIFQSKIEKDFEFFVKSLPALEPVEFCGLAKVLSIPLTKESELLSFDKEEYEKLKDKEVMQAVVAETLVPMDEVLEQMMDKYLGLTKRRRKEINQILKEIKKSRKVK